MRTGGSSVGDVLDFGKGRGWISALASLVLSHTRLTLSALDACFAFISAFLNPAHHSRDCFVIHLKYEL